MDSRAEEGCREPSGDDAVNVVSGLAGFSEACRGRLVQNTSPLPFGKSCACIFPRFETLVMEFG